jgi:hypothetical protein
VRAVGRRRTQVRRAVVGEGQLDRVRGREGLLDGLVELGVRRREVLLDVVVDVLARRRPWLSESRIRSCGRLGPAIEGTTVDRSSSSFSENTRLAIGVEPHALGLGVGLDEGELFIVRPVRRR